MIKGSDLLESIVYRGAADKELDRKTYSIDLPPIFKIFIESFKWKESLVNDSASFYYLPFLSCGEIFLEGWDYQSVFRNPINYNSDEEAEELGHISIATSHRGIFLGTKGDERDKILSNTSSLEGSSVVIADNIFEFISGLTDNLSKAARNVEEYRRFMIDMDYEGEDLEYEVEEWIKYRKSR